MDMRNDLWIEVMSAELHRSTVLIWSGLVGMVAVLMFLQLLVGAGIFAKFSLISRALTFMVGFFLATCMATLVVRGIQKRTEWLLRVARDAFKVAKEG